MRKAGADRWMATSSSRAVDATATARLVIDRGHRERAMRSW